MVSKGMFAWGLIRTLFPSGRGRLRGAGYRSRGGRGRFRRRRPLWVGRVEGGVRALASDILQFLPMPAFKPKLIEVALPLDVINKASAREKPIFYGHPETLHPWWARRPLAACRAVLWASLVDDPSAHPDKFPTKMEQANERERLFKIIEQLVVWENSNDPDVLAEARAEIERCSEVELPAVLDPFAGGGLSP